jgi:hypothetical protein
MIRFELQAHVKVFTHVSVHSATYAAIFTVLSYTTCPSLLHIQGHRYMTKRELPVHTYYKTHFSSIWVAYALVVLSLLLIIGVIVDSSVS